MSMKRVIHRACLCTVSTDDVFSFIFCLILVAIMSGARNCRDAVRSQKLYNRMKTLFPNEKNHIISASILLSNTYSSLGDNHQAAAVQSHRKIHHGKKVKPGMTCTEKDGEIVVKQLSLIICQLKF